MALSSSLPCMLLLLLLLLSFAIWHGFCCCYHHHHHQYHCRCRRCLHRLSTCDDFFALSVTAAAAAAVAAVVVVLLWFGRFSFAFLAISSFFSGGEKQLVAHSFLKEYCAESSLIVHIILNTNFLCCLHDFISFVSLCLSHRLFRFVHSEECLDI